MEDQEIIWTYYDILTYLTHQVSKENQQIWIASPRLPGAPQASRRASRAGGGGTPFVNLA